MISEQTFQGLELWPIYLSLFDQEVVTLWGDSMLEKDMILSSGGKLLFFRTEKRLVKYLLKKKKCNFSETPGYDQLVNEIKNNGWDYDLKYTYYDYSEIEELIREFRYMEWDGYESNDILNGLNMIMDAGVSLEDERICSMFFKRKENHFRPLAALADELTFKNPIESETFKDLLKKTTKEEIYSLFCEALGRICVRSVIL